MKGFFCIEGFSLRTSHVLEGFSLRTSHVLEGFFVNPYIFMLLSIYAKALRESPFYVVQHRTNH